jgi:hypothetical protein
MESFNLYEKIITHLLKNNFNLPKTIEELELPIDVLASTVSNEKFWEALSKSYPFLKLTVLLALYNKIMEKPEASAVKEFLKLLVETSSEKEGTQYFVEFFKEIEDE